MKDIFSMDKMKIGESAVVLRIETEGEMRRRFCDLGLIVGTKVECIGKSPSGDPTAFLIRGAVMALRREDSREVFVEPSESEYCFGGEDNGTY